MKRSIAFAEQMVGKAAGVLYRKLAAPFGSRALDEIVKKGIPPRLEPPLRFLFTNRASPEVLSLSARIESRRAEIARNNVSYRIVYQDQALGSAHWLETADSGLEDSGLNSRWLANQVSVPRRWGIFLNMLVEQFRPRAVLELGACAGISGAYLAAAQSHPRFVTLEGSASLATTAEETLGQFSDRAAVIHGPFDSGIHQALALLKAEGLSVDVAHIDGHHDEAATRHYVQTLIPHLSPGALILLDDISLYPGMRRIWRELSTMQGVAAAVNTGRFGLLIWDGGNAVTAQYDIARYTGVWKTRAPLAKQ